MCDIDGQGSCCCQDKNLQSFFAQENEKLRQRRRAEYVAAYNYNTDITEANRATMIEISAANAEQAKQLAERIRRKGYDKIEDADLQRQAKLMSELGHSVLGEQDFKQLQDAISNMQTNYAKVTVSSFEDPNKHDLTLEPHIQERLAKSRNAEELAHYWKEFYDKAGTPMRQHFKTYVELSNKAAKMNNYDSAAEYWLHFYEDPEFEEQLDACYQSILPLYKQIHAYVRYKLREHYGAAVVSEHGSIPMHLLGNMWGQTWENSIDLFTPYPEKPLKDVTVEMQQQGYTPLKIFQLGDEFFKSLNMRALPDSFWKLSVLEKPTDREIVCHASAWDLYEDSDVRIKMCTEVNTYYLEVVHHELGHIQYYLLYEDQPTIYRGAPNPGFHEAVGDVIGLSVTSQKHLHRIGLAKEGKLDEQSRINELFKKAVSKLVFLPFAYTMDKYRYAIFRGQVPESQWNREFWRMRAAHGGIIPPVPRSDEDFDPPAKYHIDADVEYLRYFASHIFQFQFHKALLAKAGEYEPGNPDKTLDNGDIYQSAAAGEAFSKFLSLGASKHWKQALLDFTGETKMDTGALLEYFQPLSDWLTEENKRLGIEIGWDLDETPAALGKTAADTKDVAGMKPKEDSELDSINSMEERPIE